MSALPAVSIVGVIAPADCPNHERALAVPIEGVGEHPLVGGVDVEDREVRPLHRDTERIEMPELVRESRAALQADFQVVADRNFPPRPWTLPAHIVQK